MTLSSREGQRVPDVDLCRLRDGDVQRVSAAEFFGGRRVLVFALPGAFTPTCSTAHVPGYTARANDFKKAGIDEIVCLSVNDPFVMERGSAPRRRAACTFVADPERGFTREMGMLGGQARRRAGHALVALFDAGQRRPDREDVHRAAEVPGDPFEVSDAETMLKYVRPNKQPGPARC